MSDAPADVPQIGDVIAGKYRVLRVLGEGGMGVVFEVEHAQLGQRLAMKVLHPKIQLVGETVQRFVREARAAGRLKTEHVVQVSDVDTLPGGRPYMVMELLTGFDLAQELERRGRLPAQEAVGRILEACAGLAIAHAEGIVHRDLKPANLFVASVRSGPCLKILDFGISKVTDAEDVGLTQTQSVFGTPVYMSPEHLRSAKKVDGRSDLWALGVILYELLTGRIPFEGDSVTALAASISLDTPPPLGVPDLPEGLEALVFKLLAKDPSGRPPTVVALAAELAPFADDEGQLLARKIQREAVGAAPVARVMPPPSPVTAKTSTIAPTTSPPTPQGSMKTGILLGVGVGAVLLLGAVAWKATRPEKVGAQAAPATSEAAAARPTATVAPAELASAAPSATTSVEPRAPAPPPVAPSAKPSAAPSVTATAVAPAGQTATPTATAAAPPAPPKPPPPPAENPTIL